MTTINFIIESTNDNNGLSKLAPPILTINFEEMIRSDRGKQIASYYQTTVTAPDQTLGRGCKTPLPRGGTAPGRHFRESCSAPDH